MQRSHDCKQRAIGLTKGRIPPRLFGCAGQGQITLLTTSEIDPDLSVRLLKDGRCNLGKQPFGLTLRARCPRQTPKVSHLPRLAVPRIYARPRAPTKVYKHRQGRTPSMARRGMDRETCGNGKSDAGTLTAQIEVVIPLSWRMDIWHSR